MTMCMYLRTVCVSVMNRVLAFDRLEMNYFEFIRSFCPWDTPIKQSMGRTSTQLAAGDRTVE